MPLGNLVRFLAARIEDEGLQATCTVWATKVYHPSLIDAAYFDFSIRDDSVPLPDGTYVVSFNGQKCHAARRNGKWKFPS
jgi:hypothetical protein